MKPSNNPPAVFDALMPSLIVLFLPGTLPLRKKRQKSLYHKDFWRYLLNFRSTLLIGDPLVNQGVIDRV